MKRSELPKYFEVSTGLLVGAMLVAIGQSLYHDKSILDALKQPHFVAGASGLLLSALLFLYQRRKQDK